MHKVYKFYRIFGLIVGLWFLSGCQQPSLERAGDGVNAAPALWKVSKGNRSFYLFGSVHVLPPELKWYTPKLRAVYETSEVVVLESLENKEKEKLKLLHQKYGFLPKGKVLRDYLNDEEYAVFQKIVKEADLDPYAADRMKPWFFLTVLQAKLSNPYAKNGVDRLFLSAAKRDAKTLMGLENTEEALKAISSVPLKEDIAQFKKLLRKTTVSEAEKRERVEMLIAWARGDVERMSYLFEKNLSSNGYGSLISKRNRHWYPKLVRLLKEGKRALVVVGAGHLVGKDSLLRMLKRAGYRVERVQ